MQTVGQFDHLEGLSRAFGLIQHLVIAVAH